MPERRALPQELGDRLRAVTLGRLITDVLLGALLLSIGRNLVDPAGLGALLTVGSLHLALNLVVLGVGPRPAWARLALDLSLVLDAATLAVVLAVTGGPVSPLTVLLYAEVVALTLTFGWWVGVRVSLLSSAALLWVLTMTPPVLRDPSELTAVDPALVGVLDPAVRTVLLLLGVWAVAGVTAALSRVTERGLRGSVEDLAMLRDVAHDLDPRQGLAPVADALARSVVTTLGYRRVVVFTTAAGDELVPASAAGFPAELERGLETRSLRSSAYPVYRAIEAQQPWAVLRDDPLPGALERLFGAGAPLVIAPMGTEGRLLGLVVAEVDRRFGGAPRLGGRAMRLLGALASEASLMLDNARLQSELRSLAVTDALTGLPNHRYLQQRLGEEVDRLGRRAAAGEQRTLSVALFDLDHFKNVNDTFGHPSGDTVLAAVAATADTVLRSSDVVCRYGGEEFAILLPDTCSRDAVRACERVREAIARLTLHAIDDRPIGQVTASFGIATTVGTALDRTELLNTADQALYAAKREGRDRIVHVTDVRAGKQAVGR